MTEKFKILANYIKDLSSETADIETYMFVKDTISKYHLDISVASKALKNKLIEVNTTLKFEDKELNQKKSHFEITYTSIVKINDKVKNEEELKKILLCDVQNKISSNLQKIFLNILHDSGYPEINFGKKIDFDKLYKEQTN